MTAQRYARIFRTLGLRTRIRTTYDGENVACLVALHARKSATSVLAYRAAYPRRPIILVLTGTDLYRDIRVSALALRAMEAADALVTLQPAAIRELPASLRHKARAIVQSAVAPRHVGRRRSDVLRICVVGHLRAEKDSMRAAYAVRMLDRSLRAEVVHAGNILAPRFERAVKRESEHNSRYRYLGEVPRTKTMHLIAGSDLLVQSSRIEGGANAVCEAIACGTPVLASRIPGNTGILGARYPGLFEAGNTKALARLIERAATSPSYYERLRRACEILKPQVDPQRELRAWRELLLTKL